MPDSPSPSEPDLPKLTPLPRNALVDSFEQNPLSTVNERLPEHDETLENIDAIPEEERVREAVRRVIQDGESISNVARLLHLSPASIRNWKSRYYSFLEQRAFGESNPAAGSDDAAINEATRLRFSKNWNSLIEKTHASQADFKQDPLEIFMQTSSATSWMYDEEGRVERFTVFGVIVAFIGIVAVMMFLMSDKGEVEAVENFLVTDTPLEQPKLRYDLDIDRAGLVVQKFLKADGYLAKAAFLREQEKVLPIVKEFYSHNSDKPITDAIQTYGMTGHGLISVAFDVPSLQKNYFFNLVPYRNTYQIDWMTSTMYQHEHIEKLLSEKSRNPTLLHVQISKGIYYNYGWSDSNIYQCYNITFPGLQREIYGYAANDSELGVELSLMTALEPTHAAVLEVRFPENPKDPRQVEITKLISKDWLPF